MRSFASRFVGMALCLLLAFGFSPAAHAVFTSRTAASASFSTAKLEKPATADVGISCGLLSTTITIKSFAPVPYANYHEVTIYRGLDLTLVFTGDLSQDAGRIYKELSLLSGPWRVEIRGKYKVKDSTNIWNGPPLQYFLSC